MRNSNNRRLPDTPVPPTPIGLTVAGSDSGGGAGIQADLKTFSALGVYGASVITAITAQNTREVTAVANIPGEVIAAQMAAVLSDLRVCAIKIGMLSTSEIIEAVVDGLAGVSLPVVLDPVMIAKSGDKLLQDDAIHTLKEQLAPRATLLTPNLPESATLLGCEPAVDEHSMVQQGQDLLMLGVDAVLMKGGHGSGKECVDILVLRDQPPVRLVARRLDTPNTHGTGCTLSAAIAANLAKGYSLVKSVESAHGYLNAAMQCADTLRIGSGHGPVHHFYGTW